MSGGDVRRKVPAGGADMIKMREVPQSRGGFSGEDFFAITPGPLPLARSLVRACACVFVWPFDLLPLQSVLQFVLCFLLIYLKCARQRCLLSCALVLFISYQTNVALRLWQLG